MIVCPLHHYYRPEHVDEVAAMMRLLGPPVLRGHVDRETGAVLLREGTHRIRAAHRLGLAPVIVPIRWWRSPASLERARYAVRNRGLAFPAIVYWAH